MQKKILEAHFPQGFSSVLITSNYHIYRAERIAGDAGISAGHIGAPANYLWEMLAVGEMWLT